MDYNSLIEIGSKANVVLRFKAATCINGITYEANEPYLYLKDVNVLINYSNQDKTGETDINVIANSDIKPRTVMIGGFSFSRKIASLLAKYEDSDLSYNITLFKSLIGVKEEGDNEGSILLLDDLVENDNLFVYDSDFNKIDFGIACVSEIESNPITPDTFSSGRTFLILSETPNIDLSYNNANQ
jgi:hypothetical protein